jgi:hypothetical protein
MLYMLTYDLNKADKDYAGLYQAIRNLGDCHRESGLDSVWFVDTGYSAQDISTILRARMDANDCLFVSRIRSGENAGWLSNATWNWIKARQ